jgi:YHS domain-containing protein
MTEVNELDQKIAQKLAEHKMATADRHNHMAERMHAIEERHRRYTAIADRLIRQVIRPRLERLAGHFDNATLQSEDQSGRHQCVCIFQHTPRFPATARLELSVSRDGIAESVFVLSNASILPLFFSFDGEDQLQMPLDRVDELQIAAWIDKKILGFLDAYLKLENLEQYQAENAVACPVCNMRINKLFAGAQLKHRGKDFFFCVRECAEKFAADPDKYLSGKR